jgi:hypothetical protein
VVSQREERILRTLFYNTDRKGNCRLPASFFTSWPVHIRSAGMALVCEELDQLEMDGYLVIVEEGPRGTAPTMQLTAKGLNIAET